MTPKMKHGFCFSYTSFSPRGSLSLAVPSACVEMTRATLIKAIISVYLRNVPLCNRWVEGPELTVESVRKELAYYNNYIWMITQENVMRRKKRKSKRIERIGLFTAAESGLPKQVWRLRTHYQSISPRRAAKQHDKHLTNLRCFWEVQQKVRETTLQRCRRVNGAEKNSLG